MFLQSIITTLFLVLIGSNMAMAQLPKDNENFRMGMSFGFSPSFTFGSELENPRLKNGIQSGFYYRPKLKKNLYLQTGINIGFRGSRYKNEKDDHYNQLNLINMELPTMLMIDVSKSTGKHMVVGGLVPYYVIQSEVYIFPEQTARDEFRNVGLFKFDVAALVGYHINTYYVGLQFSAQMGLLNLNEDFNLAGVFPATGKGKPIKLMTFNCNIYF